MDSVRANIGESDRYVFLCDPSRGQLTPESEPASIMEPDVLTEFADRDDLRFLIPPGGLCCVLKSLAAKFLTRTGKYDFIIYLDADTLVLHRPEGLIQALDNHSIVLTPHLLDGERFPQMDVNTMKSGAYNAGVFAINASSDAAHFLDWWSQNMLDPDKMDYLWNYDQGWLNLAPAVCSGVHILKDHGCNVAFWNLHERKISVGADEQIFAGSTPLSIFHFSFFDWKTPEQLAGRFNDGGAIVPEPVKQLQKEYAKKLTAAGVEDAEEWDYPYSKFSDGHPINDYHRAYYRQHLRSRLTPKQSPFDANLHLEGFSGLRSLRNADHPLVRSIRKIRSSLRK